MLVKVGTQQQATAKQGQIHDGARVSLLCYNGNILCVITTISISKIEHACQTSICEIRRILEPEESWNTIRLLL